ncbi:CHAT domain-containing protein [Triangularia verruculosa]|uniref:CHAT domain-containing protein n=1 Tax=Triangularia verruculosa TaxID=2587418 RepID=A0AAN6XE26_9PEZI|nr:CHAT domain-containing protein [Triangularia verruculosa]
MASYHDTNWNHLFERAMRHWEEYCNSSDASLLDQAIGLMEQAIPLIPEANLNLPTVISNLSVFYHARYIGTSSSDDLSRAVLRAEKALEITPKGDPDRASRLTNLSNALEARYGTGERENDDLNHAIAASEEAVSSASNDDPDLYAMLNNLAKQLGQRYVDHHDLKDLHASIEALTRAEGMTPETKTGDRATILQQLGVRLHDRFLATGDRQDLDKAIQTTRSALDICPQSNKDFWTIASELGNRLGARYTITWEQQDLDEAIRITKKALDATPPDHLHRPMILADLSNRLGYKHSRTEESSDLKNAIWYCQQSLNLTKDGDSHRPRRLNSLATLLYRRYLAHRDTEDLTKSISNMRKCLPLTGTGHSHYAGWARDLSMFLSHARDENADESIKWAKIAVAKTPKGHSERAAFLIHLATGLLKRSPKDQARSKEYLLEAFYDSACPIGDRLSAGRHLLLNMKSLFVQQDDMESAYRVAEETIGLISLFAPQHLQNEDKQNVLTLAVGLASEAAAVALAIRKDTADALRFLEDGRGVLLGSLYDLRSNIETVGQQYPDLASQFIHLQQRLNTPALSANDTDARTAGISGGTAVLSTDQRREAGESMKELVATIRSKPGFEQFLLPPSSSEVLTAATEGPIVVLNVSHLRCDALVIKSCGIHCLPLTQLNYEDVERRSTKLREDLDLAWLWDAVVGPVFDFLGFNTTPLGNQWPRVRWVPTGALIKFPLHAAGNHLKGGGETALDRAISSYSPSVKSIIHSRQRQAMGEPTASGANDRNLVLVPMEKTEGHHAHLSQVPKEIATVQRLGEEMHLSIDLPACNKNDVLASLQKCRILHFAGHGFTHRTQPLKSSLLLRDWKDHPLTVQSLLDIDLASSPPFLAYLSACGSGLVDHEKSVDESIHLSSAFQLAGFRHVVGTLWAVNDYMCVEMARLVYEHLKRNGMTDASVSTGLHHATRYLRDVWARSVNPALGGSRESERPGKYYGPGEKKKSRVGLEPLWVPYVHFGV